VPIPTCALTRTGIDAAQGGKPAQARHAQFNPSRLTEADMSELGRIVDLEIRPDGSALLFYGRAGEGQLPAGFRLFEDHVAGLTTRTFAALGSLYATANY